MVAQRADVGSICAIWGLQDNFALDNNEEEAIKLKYEPVTGEDVGNPTFSIPKTRVEFTDVKVVRIKTAIETGDALIVRLRSRLA